MTQILHHHQAMQPLAEKAGGSVPAPELSRCLLYIGEDGGKYGSWAVQWRISVGSGLNQDGLCQEGTGS